MNTVPPSTPGRPESPSSGAEQDGPITGMRFNSTGREDTTSKVLRPQNGGAGRRAALVAVVICIAAGIAWVSYFRSGVSLHDVFNDRDQPSFGSQQTGPTATDTK